jgi:integrase/recombinase XerD
LKVSLHTIAEDIIGERKAPNEPVFYLPTQDGANKVLGIWVRQNAKIGKHITWHCLRHSVSDILQYQGVDVATVTAVLGHTSPKYVMANYKKRVKIRHTVEAIQQLPTIEVR